MNQNEKNLKKPYEINTVTGECTLTKMSKQPDKEPNPHGSWGIGMYNYKGESGYGFMRTSNPNDFSPDYECCTPWEIANHKAAVELYDSGKWND